MMTACIVIGRNGLRLLMGMLTGHCKHREISKFEIVKNRKPAKKNLTNVENMDI